MINIFRPKVTVQQIHSEFDAAQERLLQQAKELSQSANMRQDEIEAAILHEKLGFVNSPSVKAVNSASTRVVTSKRQADFIQHYKMYYPFLKFLTEQELDRICHKYNLIYAPIASFIEDVPLKNLKEIDAAEPLTDNDKAENLYRVVITGWYDFVPKRVRKLVKQIEIQKDRMDYYNRSLLTRHVREYLKANGIHFEIGEDHNVAESYEKTEIDKQGLFIAAPKSSFNLKGVKKKGFGYFNMQITVVKDPIVFRYCKGGLQILSKWGAEASDEMTVNEKMN